MCDNDSFTAAFNRSLLGDFLLADGVGASSSSSIAEGVDQVVHHEVKWMFLGLGIIPLWILIGNSLVLIAVCGQKSLRTLSNWVIASLAFTDFLLALLVVPLGMYQVITDQWDLGLAVCIMWTGTDVFLSTTSILHLSAIAIHRYCGIKYPLRMRSSQNKRHVLALVVPAWTISVAISVPLVVQGVMDPSHVLMGTDEAGYSCGIFDRTFAIYSSLVSFFIPLAIMVFTDLGSIQILRKSIAFPSQVGKRLGGKDKATAANANLQVPGSSGALLELSRTGEMRGNNLAASSTVEYRACPSYATSEQDLVSVSPPITPRRTRAPTSRCGGGGGSGGGRGGASSSSSSKQRHLYRGRPRSKSMVYISMLASRGAVKLNSRERRAEKALIWVFVSFVVLWLPFFCTNLTYGVCASCDIPPELFSTFTWLGYMSSGVNPCIYTLLNRDFRRAFARILACKRDDYHRRPIR